MDNGIFSVESTNGSDPVFGDRVRLVDAYPLSELTEIEPAREGHEHVMTSTRWHCGFDFEPKRNLTPAERERFEDAVIAAARGFLDSLPDDFDTPPANAIEEPQR